MILVLPGERILRIKYMVRQGGKEDGDNHNERK